MTQIIIQNGNTCQLEGPQRILLQLYNEYKIKHPNAWHIQMYQKRNSKWDGHIKYISQTGRFKIGLLSKVVDSLKSLNEKVKIIDKRLKFNGKDVTPVIPDIVGDLTLYPRQKKSLEKLLFNEICGIPFTVGCGDLAVGFGKCVGGESLINTSRGIYRIDEVVNKKGELIYPKLKVLASDGNYHLIKASICNTIKAIRITTLNGYTQVCGYDNHRYFTITPKGNLEWVLANTLKVGDYIPISKVSKQSHSSLNITPDEAYLMGCIQGDGHVSRKSPTWIHIGLSGKDYEIAQACEKALNGICIKPCEVKAHKKFQGWHINKSDRALSRLIIDRYPELIGLASEKKIPKSILDSPPEIQWSYLAGLFDTDGSKSSKVLEYSFSSINPENIHRLQYMLLQLGIICFVSPKKTLCNGKRGITHRLRIGAREFENFGKAIPLKVPRKQYSPKDLENSRSKLWYQLPHFIGEKCKEHYKNQSFSTRNNPLDLLTRHQIRDPRRITLNSLDKLLREAPSKELQRFSDFSSKVYWDKIKSIEILDQYECYDIEVEEVHQYLADGFICHNTMLFAAIHEAYQRKLKTILLLNDADLFNQFKREIPPMLPGEDISFIQGGPKSNRIGNFNVAMVQSLSRNLKAYSYMLSQIDICLIDEADIIDNNTYKNVIEQLYNTQVRIGLSGTIYMSKLKKDQVHNMNVMSFIGPKLDIVTLKDQMKSGRATPVIVKMVPVPQVSMNHQYQEEYQENVVNNPKAYQISWERVKYNASYGRMPMLIVTKIIDHSKTLYKFLQEKNKAMGNPYKIAQVDHTTSNRKAILESFRLGEIDILVSTTIISRGKNFPTLKYLQNAAGMDSNEKSIQILGRLVRQHKSKNKAYLDDLAYQGSYLSRHSKHRTRYYKNEKLKVIVLSRVSPLYTKVNPKDYSQMRNESEGERGKRIKEML